MVIQKQISCNRDCDDLVQELKTFLKSDNEKVTVIWGTVKVMSEIYG
jgi:hypothetical protein